MWSFLLQIFPATYQCSKVYILCVSPKGPAPLGNIRRLCILCPTISGDISFHNIFGFSLLMGSRVWWEGVDYINNIIRDFNPQPFFLILTSAFLLIFSSHLNLYSLMVNNPRKCVLSIRMTSFWRVHHHLFFKYTKLYLTYTLKQFNSKCVRGFVRYWNQKNRSLRSTLFLAI